MTDQAETLRKNGSMQQTYMSQPSTRVMSFTSGKGGVGKTHTVINLAIALAERGRRVLVFDADLSLANADLLLGVDIQYTIQDVLRGTKTFRDIIIDAPSGISLIPAASGVESLVALSAEERITLMQSIEEIAGDYDYLFIDTPAGISADVMYFNAASSEIVCLINAEPTSLTDAYALMKILAQNYGEKEISILVNNVRSEREAKRAYSRLTQVAEQYLQLHLKYIGWVPNDEHVHAAIVERSPLLLEYPSSQAARSLTQLADSIDQDFYECRMKGGMQFFFQQLVEVGAYGG